MTRRDFTASALAATLAFQLRADEPVKKLRVAVIGHTGRGDYGHGVDTMWASVPGTEIVAVADADAKGLAAAQKRLKVERGFEDYKKMLTEVKPDLVAIGMRHLDQHRNAIIAACQADARGIYMEKPFCRTLGEADEIIAACEKHSVKLALAHRNRYHPVLLTISTLVKESAIGQLLEIRARGKEDHRGGAEDMWVLGAHLFNLAAYFAGKPLTCSATVLQAGKPVTKADVKEGPEGIGPMAGNEIHARFDMESGIPLFFDSKQNAGTKDAGFGLQLIGTKGVIDLRIDLEPLAQILEGSPFKPTQPPRAWQPVSSVGIGKPEPQPGTAKHVMGHIAGALDLMAAITENRQPLCSAADGRTAIGMITAVFESHRLNGQRVAFPLQTKENPLSAL